MFLILLLLFFLGNAHAGDWMVRGSAGYLTGEYIYTTTTSTYSLNGGIYYETEKWNTGISLPLIIQNSGLVSGSGGMIIPSHHGQNENDMSGGYHEGRMGGGRINTDGTGSQYEAGIGDVYLSGQYHLMRSDNLQPVVSITSKIKIPTASTSENFGTGEFDYGFVLNFSKTVGKYVGFLDAGYWFLGDSPEIDYENPFTYGVGIGRFFGQGKFSALLYYQRYSEILPEYEPPRRLSGGLYYNMNPMTVLSFNITGGVSETSPGFGLSAGISYEL